MRIQTGVGGRLGGIPGRILSLAARSSRAGGAVVALGVVLALAFLTGEDSARRRADGGPRHEPPQSTASVDRQAESASIEAGPASVERAGPPIEVAAGPVGDRPGDPSFSPGPWQSLIKSVADVVAFLDGKKLGFFGDQAQALEEEALGYSVIPRAAHDSQEGWRNAAPIGGRIPKEYAGELEFSWQGHSARVKPLWGKGEGWEIDGVVAYEVGEGAQRLSVLRVPLVDRIEEFLLLDAAAGGLDLAYEILPGRTVTEVRATEGGWVELWSGERPYLRLNAIEAMDSAGRIFHGWWEIEDLGGSYIARAHVNLDEAAYPVVIDPGWSSTASMATPRGHHATTLLPSGKVLASAGYDGTGYIPTCELYDPATGTWAATGSMGATRGYFTTTLLPSGKVLAAGGWNAVAVNPCELYDPATGTWTPTGALATGRYWHTATLLASGKVLVVGGMATAGGTYLDACELYDPATGTWTSTGSLATVRAYHTATLLPSGKVLMTGGYNGTSLAFCQLYDPATGTWAATGLMAAARYEHTSTLLPSGKVLVAGGPGISSCEIYDPATGAWAPTGSMATARYDHTATLLPSGKLLAAGGQVPYLASCEIYDPTSGAWTAAGSLATARALHIATLLPSGNVLVVGGYNPGYLSSCEVYNQAGGAWAATGPLAIARYQHTATRLPSGKVLVAAGYNAGVIGSCEVYDPASGTWAATDPLATARYDHTATLLPSGKVLVTGGMSLPGGGYLASCELYDPASGTWAGTGSLSAARAYHTATLLPTGKVLVAGGYNGATLSSCDLYDPASGTWTPTGPIGARYEHAATLLSSGNVLAAGGYNGGTLNTCEIYDTGTGVWTPTGPLGTPSYALSATLLGSGRVLVAGGRIGGAMNSCEIYDPALGTWSATGLMATARAHFETLLLPSGNVLAAGGWGGNSQLCEIYNPAAGIWSVTTVLSSPREFHTTTLLTDGKVLAAGTSTLTTACELYGPATGSWNVTGSLPAARERHTATLLAGGKLLVAGGDNGAPLASSALYDPAPGTWTPAATMTTSRRDHTANLLHTGNVLVAGGDGGAPLASCEVYDAAGGSWTPTAPLGTPRRNHTATMLASRKILVAGGDGGAPLASCEVYDATTGAWTPTGPMTDARYDHTATLLPSGKILVAGGEGGGPLASCEIYDPAAGTWTPTGPMATARRNHTATLLPSGRVLVAGGLDAAELYSCEIYDPTAGTWSAAPPLAAPRYDQTATILPSGKLLLAGGFPATATCATYDPTSGIWSDRWSMATARASHTASLLPSGEVLLAGGNDGSPLSSCETYEDTDAQEAWRPSIDTVAGEIWFPVSANFASTVALTGTRFRGVSESSSGSMQNSSSDQPMVRLLGLDAGSQRYLVVPATQWADGMSMSVQVLAATNTPGTYYALCVVTNGIPSRARIVKLTTSTPPAAPVNGPVAPQTGAFVTSATPTLSASAFSDPDVGETHAASHWQARPNAGSYGGGGSWDSGVTTTGLTSMAIPGGSPLADGVWWFRVRYQDREGMWSAFSAETSFNVNATAPDIAVSKTFIMFTAVEGGPNPSSQTFDVTNVGVAGSTLNYTVAVFGAWLSAAPLFGSLAQGDSDTLTVSVNTAGLLAGSYGGGIIISDPAAPLGPKMVSVGLQINPPAGPAAISPSPTALAFNATQGGAAPGAQTLQVQNTGGTNLTLTATPGAAWIAVSPAGGTVVPLATLNVQVFVNPSGLPAGTYTGSITLSDPAASNSPQTVSVQLTILPPGALPLVLTSVTPDQALVPSAITLDLFGSGFSAGGATLSGIYFVRDGQPSVAADTITVLADGQARAAFSPPTDAVGGWRDVVVVRSDGTGATLATAFFFRRFRIESFSPSEMTRSGTFRVFLKASGIGPYENPTLSFALVAPDGTKFPITIGRRIWDRIEGTVTLATAPPGTYAVEAVVNGARGTLDNAVTVVPFVLSDPAEYPPMPRGALLSQGSVAIAVWFDAVEPSDPPTFELAGARGTLTAAEVLSDPSSGTRTLSVTFRWEPTDAGIVGDYDLVISQANRVESIPAALTISPLRVDMVAPQPISSRPAAGGDVIEIQGYGFEPNAVVRLEFLENPWTDVAAPSPYEYRPEELEPGRIRFRNFARITPGLYDVVVVNPDGVPCALSYVPVGLACGIGVDVFQPPTRRPNERGAVTVMIRNLADFPMPERALRIEVDNLTILEGVPETIGPLDPGESVQLSVPIQAFALNEIPAEDMINTFTARAWIRVRVEPFPEEVARQAESARETLEAAVAEAEALAVEAAPAVEEVRRVAASVARAAQERADPLLRVAAVTKAEEPQWEAWMASEAASVRETALRLEAAQVPLREESRTMESAAEAATALAAVVDAAVEEDWSLAQARLLEYGRGVQSTAERLAEEYPDGATMEVVQTHLARLWSYFDPDCGGEGTGDTAISAPPPPPPRRVIRIVTSRDPNDKVVGNDREAVIPGERVSYMIRFENLAPSEGPMPAPALVVEVEDRLDGALDPSTVELGTVSHPNALVTSTVDVATGRLFWRFEQINLLPNQNPPEGEGFVTFTVLPRDGLASGTRIPNVARIWFDPEEGSNPIDTPQATVTLDSEPPVMVEATIISRGEGSVRLRVDAQDDASGVLYVRVFGRSNASAPWVHYRDVGLNGPVEVELTATETTEFSALAVDKAGNESSRVAATEGAAGDETPQDGAAEATGSSGGGGGGCAAGRGLASVAALLLLGMLAAGVRTRTPRVVADTE